MYLSRQLQTRGDAELWVAPRKRGAGTVTVLTFSTTALGARYAVALTTDDLVRIRDSAEAILNASADDIDGWLDGAAAVVRAACVEPSHPNPPHPATEKVTA